MPQVAADPPLTTPFYDRDEDGKIIGLSLPWMMFFIRLSERADYVDGLNVMQAAAAAAAPAAAAAGITPFTDDFNRANLYSAGKWIGSRGNASTISTYIDANRFAVGATGISAAQAGAGYCVATPTLFTNTSQYMKMTYKAYSGGTPRGGPGLYFNGEIDAAGGYFIFLVPDSPTVHLGSWAGSAGGYVTAISLNISTLAANDIFELQVNITAPENLINVWRIGVQIVTNYSDSTVGRPTTGWPAVANANSSGVFYLDDYELRDVR